MARPNPRWNARIIHLLAFGVPLYLAVTPAGATTTEVTGDYRYTFHEPETAESAQTYACRQATKAAISRSQAFREATASLVDSPLLRDTVDTLAQDAMKDVRVLEQFVKGHTASCAVSGRLDPQEITRILVTQMQGRPELAQPGLDQNRALKILRVNEDKDGGLLIIFQALRRLDWLSTAYQGSLREQADIMVEFFDEQGQPISLTRYPARKTPAGDDVMNPGEVGIRRVAKPAGTKSYRVWVAK